MLTISRRAVVAGAVALLIAAPTRVSAAALDEATVKALIEKPWSGAKFTWRTIQMATPRKASIGEISASGLPPDVIVTPVQVDFTRVLGDGGRDVRQQYLFYQDDFQKWTMQPDAVPYNYESDLYYVKP